MKGLVVLHDGTMTIESAPGEGTIVTISVPVAGPNSAAEAAGGDATKRTEFSSEAGNGTQRKTA